MNALALLEALAQHGPALLLGVTVVLLAGSTTVALHRSPAQRRRLGVLTALGAALYLAVGVAPLPRVALRHDAPRDADVVAAPLSAAARTAMLRMAMDELADARPVAVSPRDGSAAAVADAPSLALPREDAPLPPPAAAPAWWERAAAWPWALLLAGAYAVGVVAMLVRTIGGRLRLRALLAACRPVPASLLRGLELPAGTRVLGTARAVRPFCAGFARPVVVLPEAMLAPERAAELHAVVRHEAAHVRAGDPRVWSLLAWLAVPLFCHPLFWWLCREVRFCSELLADDAAARCGGRQLYARALIDLAERSGPQVAAAGTVAVFHRPSEFYRRIQMLLARQGSLPTSIPRWRRCAHALSMLCLVGGAASVFGVPAPAQEPARSLKKENADLRATVDTLRDELAALRAQFQALRDAHAPGKDSPRTYEFIESVEPETIAYRDFVRAWHLDTNASPLPTEEAWRKMVEAKEFAGRLGTTPSQIEWQGAPPQDPVRAAGAPTGTGAPVGAPPAGAPEGGVPVLKDLPLLGAMFTPGTEGSGAIASSPTREYIVKKGDSFERIAKQELGDVGRAPEIVACNQGVDAKRLRPGQRILLPAGGDPFHGDLAAGAPRAGAADPVVDDARTREIARTYGFLNAQQGGDAALAPSPSGVAAISDLTARYLDLQGELEEQRVTYEEAKTRAEAGQATQGEAMRAAVRLRTLEKKLAIASRLIDGEIGATESELQWLEKRRTDCSATERMQIDTEMHRAKMRLEALRAAKN